ncbi:hypothetical protein L6452_33419 [Arctium lappa]|uniref:Uncharacterized protein n=1 Tax=Arctium lappa TaxID=4217 RepID=A0ACB8YFY2_ARCLA|nr:hypothetical protein L6452_33419 [Arctium lappa]
MQDQLLGVKIPWPKVSVLIHTSYIRNGFVVFSIESVKLIPPHKNLIDLLVADSLRLLRIEVVRFRGGGGGSGEHSGCY